MHKGFIIGAILLLVLIIFTGCAQPVRQQTTQPDADSGISKEEAMRVASSWAKGQGAGNVETLSAYREGNQWRVQISLYDTELRKGTTGFVEIDARTGVVECLVDEKGSRNCY